MNHIHLSNSDITGYTQDILRQMQRDKWKPDYIVGLTRGGLIPAVYISQYLNVPMHALKVSMRDHTNDNDSNCWMAEDAYGYDGTYAGKPIIDEYKQKNILIVDDINDSGATLNWIVQDWQASCLPKSPGWNDIWGKSVRFATLIDNASSKFEYTVNYTAREINKAEDPSWIIFPWEDWWLHKS